MAKKLHKKTIRVRTREDAQKAREALWAHEDSIRDYNPEDKLGRRHAFDAIDHARALSTHAQEHRDRPGEIDWLKFARGSEQLARLARKLSAAQTDIHIDATDIPVQQREAVQKQLNAPR